MCPMRSSPRKPTTSWYWNYGGRRQQFWGMFHDVSRGLGNRNRRRKRERCVTHQICAVKKSERRLRDIGWSENAENVTAWDPHGHVHRLSKGLDDTSNVSTSAGCHGERKLREISRGLGFPHHLVIKNCDRSPKLKCLFIMGALDSQKLCSIFEKHLGIHRNILKFESLSFCMMKSFQLSHFGYLGVVALAAMVGSDPEGRWILFLELFRNTSFLRQRSTVSEYLYLNLPKKLRIFMDISFSLPNI